MARSIPLADVDDEVVECLPPPPPTLHDAFDVLAKALLPLLLDNVPGQIRLQEIRALHADGNIGIAWRHIILTLEGVLGVSLRS